MYTIHYVRAACGPNASTMPMSTVVLTLADIIKGAVHASAVVVDGDIVYCIFT